MTCFTCCKGKASSTPLQSIDIEEDIEVSGIQNAIIYSYKELRIATEDFSPANKIGQGGFGSVYKGKLRDESLAAVKVLFADLTQGMQEFLIEVKVISSLEHENLEKLYGCCVEGNHRLLVYGYLENNSFAQTLLGHNYSGIYFSWNIQTRMCIGTA